LPSHLYKQIDELTIADLDKYPVWEFVSEDDPHATDECTIKAFDTMSDRLEGDFIVKTKFILNDQTVHFGYVKPERTLSSCQPVIIIDDQRVLFWHGVMKPIESDLSNFYKLLNKKIEDIFPIIWNTEISMEKIETGTIDGFGYYNSVIDSFDDIIQIIK
jgi:hypothetical protein